MFTISLECPSRELDCEASVGLEVSIQRRLIVTGPEKHAMFLVRDGSYHNLNGLTKKPLPSRVYIGASW